MTNKLAFVAVLVVDCGGILTWISKALLGISENSPESCGERRFLSNPSVVRALQGMGCSELCLLQSAMGHDGSSLACVNFDGKGGAKLAPRGVSEHCGWGHQIDKTRASRARHFEQFLRDAAPTNGTKGSALVELHDGSTSTPDMGRRFAFLHTPILSSSAHIDQKHIMLIPDADFVGSRGYRSLNTKVDLASRRSPWHKKKTKVVFRGSTTGFIPSDPNIDQLRRNTRIALALLAKERNQDSSYSADYLRWDVAVSTVNLPGVEVQKAVLALGITKPELDYDDQIAARGIFDVDGNTNAWSACWWKLRSNSVALKVHSPLRQWYYHRLSPWVHFIPIREDLSDVDQKVAFVLNASNDKFLKNISRAATQLTRDLSYEIEVAKVRAQLEACFAHGHCAPGGRAPLSDSEISALESAFLKGLNRALEIDVDLWVALEEAVGCHAAVLKI